MPPITPVTRVRAMTDWSQPDELGLAAFGFRRDVPDGSVLLFDENFFPLWPANEFLIRTCRTPANDQKSWNTQHAYADDLVQWWTHLRRSKIGWRDARRQDVRDFIAHLRNERVSRSTKRKLTARTVRRRVTTVLKFYGWAIAERLLPPQQDMFALDERRSLYRMGPDGASPFSSDLGSRQTLEGLLPRVPGADETVSLLSDGRWTQILNELGPRSDSSSARPKRDRLVAETAFWSGMRVEEVCGLTLSQLLDAADDARGRSPDELVSIRIELTKGKLVRDIFLPVFHIDNLLAYVRAERSPIVEKARRRGKFDGGLAPSDALFLNGLRSTLRDQAEPVTEDTIMRAFTRAVVKAGLLRRVAVHVLDEAGQPKRDARGRYVKKIEQHPRHSFHDLRHTFAVNYYRVAVMSGQPEPWKKLQVILGHAWMKVTVDTYLRHVQVRESIISDLQEMYLRHREALYA